MRLMGRLTQSTLMSQRNSAHQKTILMYTSLWGVGNEVSVADNLGTKKGREIIGGFYRKYNTVKISKDLMTTPQGTREKKKCYWLNRKYVLSKILNLN